MSLKLSDWCIFFYAFRNIIHGSDGPETAKDEINLWFKPEELVSYTSSAEKWVYGDNWDHFFSFNLLFVLQLQPTLKSGINTKVAK